MPRIAVKIAMNVGNPELAFEFAQLPNAGVGLARLEFIINNEIGVHPRACLEYADLPAALKKKLDEKCRGYADPRTFFVEKMVEGIATIAAAFWPKPVIVRLSDFKSNEYRKQGKYVGICGQGPSDHPDLARWLMEQGIESLSLNPDTVVSTWMALAEPTPPAKKSATA